MQTVAIPYGQLKVGAVVRVKIGILHMRQYDLVSRYWDGEITAVEWWQKGHLLTKQIDRSKLGTLKSVKMTGVPTIEESHYCRKCGQYIERENMRAFGYGPGCADKLGIPQWDNIRPELIDDLKSNLALTFKRELLVEIQGTEFEVVKEAPPIQPQQERDWDVRFIIENNEIVVATDPSFRMVVRSIPGHRWDARYNVWRFPNSPAIALGLKNAFNGYRRRGSPEFLALIQQAEGQREAQQLKVIEDLPPIPHLNGNGGWQHQRQAFAFMIKTLTGKLPASYEKGNDDD